MMALERLRFRLSLFSLEYSGRLQGLKRNVLTLYKFLVRNYHSKNDHIYLFGFSRGAFTINVLLGLIASQGLVRYATESELNWKAEEAFRSYRLERSRSIIPVEKMISWLRAFISPRRRYSKAENLMVLNVRFVGLFDTVGAYGLPLDSMTRALSRWFWPLDLPNRELPSLVRRACHALSLDDERATFHPILWNERAETRAPPDSSGSRHIEDERITQVWFPGSHANIGGGYPDDSLAHVPLCWILEEAQKCGLELKSTPYDALGSAKSVRDLDGRFYDSRCGMRIYYRYSPRKLSELCSARLSRWPGDEVYIETPKIDESVFQRIERSTRPYAPIGIPGKYEIVTERGIILGVGQHAYEKPEQATSRSYVQESIWDLVWLRKILGVATILILLFIAIFPAFNLTRNIEYATPIRAISDLIEAIGILLPGFVDVWISAFAAAPSRFMFLVLALVVLYRLSSILKMKIADRMRLIWKSPTVHQRSRFNDIVYLMRTNSAYRRAQKWDLWPNILALLFLCVVVVCCAVVINRVLFSFEDASGILCRESDHKLATLPRGHILLKDGESFDYLEDVALGAAVGQTPSYLADPFEIPALPVFRPSECARA